MLTRRYNVIMPVPVLSAKLNMPPRRPSSIRRHDLIARLNAGVYHRLTLISAPAGFGKTTVLTDWISELDHPVAWLSLDAAESDPLRFMVYLISALQTIQPVIGQTVLDGMQGSQPPSPEALLTPLLNDIAAIPEKLLLVLDDYHVIDSGVIDALLAALLEYLPPQMHLVIATREDPNLPIARLRARDQLTELRVSDLRFSAQEASDFLRSVMGLDLSLEEIRALEQRTEGWIAGLQLAALSLQGRTDSSEFIRGFTGSHRFVLDYLTEEVLRLQPEAIRRFLLQTSILDDLNASLCDAVTGRNDSQKMLETLERSNLFVIALDHDRQWYRYHHLFAEALRLYLQNMQEESFAELHLRASHWYQGHNRPQEAIRHALASGNSEQAADLIERIWPQMDENYQSGIWFRWVEALPETVIRSRPNLCHGYARCLLYQGDIAGCDIWLQVAWDWLDARADVSGEMHIGDEEQFRQLPASLNCSYAYRALVAGDLEAALEYARQALSFVTEDDHLSFTQSTVFSAIACWSMGELIKADQILTDFIEQMEAGGHPEESYELMTVIGDIRMTVGQLYRTHLAYEHALQLISNGTKSQAYGKEDLYRGLAELNREWGRLELAEEQLSLAEQLGEERVNLPQWHERLYTSWARLKLSRGDTSAALSYLDKAERYQVHSPLPVVRPLAALRARVRIVEGRLDSAQEWARQQKLSADDDITFLKEYSYITLARLLIARYRLVPSSESLQAANRLLERLHGAAEEGARTGSLIEILILRAVLSELQGEHNTALMALQEALSLAEPQNYVQLFVDEGPIMAHLLSEAVSSGTVSDYVDSLLKAFNRPAASLTAIQPLIEPLSERELDVLRLLASDLSGPEIARNLMISLNTMRTHTKNIYSKLSVSSRLSALRRAEELGLL